MTKKERRIITRCIELCSARGYGLAFSLVGKREDAEDIVQEALMAATNKVATLTPRPWPWLATTIINLAHNHRRKLSRRGPSLPLLEDEAREEDTPLEQVLRRELRRELMSEFHALGDSQREAITLVYLAGLTLREAAKERGQPYPSFQRELAKALETLGGRLRTSKKNLLSNLPLLSTAMPSAAFTASLGTSAGIGVLNATTISTASLTLGGITMKKYATAIVILLLLATALGGWFALGDDAPPPRAVAGVNDENSQEGMRERVLDETDSSVTSEPIAFEDSPLVRDQKNQPDAEELQEVINKAPEEAIEETFEEDIENQPITIRVIDEEGQPIAGAVVSKLLRTHDFSYSHRIFQRWRTDEKGEISVSRLEIRPVDIPSIHRRKLPDLDVDIGAHGFRSMGLGAPIPESGVVEITLVRLEEHNVSVLVEDTNGNPIPGVSVCLASSKDVFFHFSAVSDAYGLATIRPQSSGVDWWAGGDSIVACSNRRDPGDYTIYRDNEIARTKLKPNMRNDPFVRLVIADQKLFRGRVLLSDRNPAANASVTAVAKTARRLPAWTGVVTSSKDGYFTFPADNIKELEFVFSWRDDYSGAEEYLHIKKFEIADDHDGAPYEFVLERVLFVEAQTFLDGVAVEGVMYDSTWEGKPYWAGNHSSDGSVTTFRWTESFLTTEDGAARMIRAKTEDAMSEFQSVRAAALAGKSLRFELKAIERGTVSLSFVGEKFGEDFIYYELTTRGGGYGFKTENGKLSGDKDFVLPSADYTLSMRASKQSFLVEEISFQIQAGKTLNLPVRLHKSARLEIINRAKLPEGYDLNCYASLKQRKKGYWIPASSRDSSPLWPYEEHFLEVSLSVNGARASRKFDIPPVAAGESTSIDITEAAAQILAEVQAALTKTD